METAIQHLLNRLEEIGRDDEGLYDTYVKEQTADRFIRMFFVGAIESSSPVDYGMLSEKGDKAICDAFTAFAEELAISREFDAANNEEKFRILNTVITDGGQFADSFFGELTPDNIGPETTPKRPPHWLSAKPVYFSFIAVPAILTFLVAVLAFPDLIKGPVKLLVFVCLTGFVSLWIGDYSYQFVARKTYRKPRRENV